MATRPIVKNILSTEISVWKGIVGIPVLGVHCRVGRFQGIKFVFNGSVDCGHGVTRTSDRGQRTEDSRQRIEYRGQK